MTENGKVTGIVFKKCLSVLDENGRFAPVYDENQTKTVACSHVYLSIGQAIEWGHLLDGYPRWSWVAATALWQTA